MAKKLALFFCLLALSATAIDYPAELIRSETRVLIQNGKLQTDYVYEIRINNRAGEDFCKIQIPFSPMVKVKNIHASILNSLGKEVRRLDSDEITERSLIQAYSFYEDDMVKEFILKHNAYPYTIRWSYQYQQKEFLHIQNWSPVFSPSIPTLEADLWVTYPPNYELKYRNQLLEEPIKENSSNNMVSLHWHTDFRNPLKEEVWAPSLSDYQPEVWVVPENFIFSIPGSFKSWISFGIWQEGILAGLDVLPPAEELMVRKLTDTLRDASSKVRALYHYLQDQTRYINISIETGGLKPYPASYVAQMKYGDCKALANYMKAMLKVAGIQALYAKVKAGVGVAAIDTSFPAQQFNHVILYLPAVNNGLWLDCTSKDAMGYLGPFIQNRYAFVVNGTHSMFKKIPKLQPEQVQETRKFVFYAYNEIAKAECKTWLKGEQYELLSELGRNSTKNDRKRIIHKRFAGSDLQIDTFNVATPSRDSTWVELNYLALTSTIYKYVNKTLLLQNLAFGLPKFEKPTLRKLPLSIEFPFFKVDTLVYFLPQGYQVSHSLDPIELHTNFGSYSLSLTNANNRISLVKKLKINQGVYPIETYDTYYSFYTQVYEAEHSILAACTKSN